MSKWFRPKLPGDEFPDFVENHLIGELDADPELVEKNNFEANLRLWAMLD
jgi:hypothetical protein